MSKRVFLILPLLILASTVSLHSNTLRVNASASRVGLICLADPSSTNSSNPCPAAPMVFNGPSPSPSLQRLPTQVLIGVYVSNSDALNGFDIQLKTNSSILKPAGASLSGSLFSGSGISSTSTICAGGVGPQCGPTDGADVLDVEAVMLQTFTNNPATGLLFTATYNITGTTPAGGIAIGYQTGCSRSSIAGPPLLCVTIADGTNTPLPETVQTGARFDNRMQPNWVALTSQKQTLVFVRGVSSDTATITATAENGWPFFSSDTVTFSAVTSSSSLSANLFPGPCSTNGVSCSVNVTVFSALVGTGGGAYSLTVLGTYVFTDPNTGLSDTLVGPVVFQVLVQDVTVSLGPSGTVYMFGTLPLAATVQTFGGYAGSVTLSTQSVNPTTGLTFQYPLSFSIGVNGLVTKTVNVTSSLFNLYGYIMRVSITGSGCVPFCSRPSITHSASIERFLASGFKLTPNATSTAFRAGSSSTLTITAQSIGSATVANDFAGLITPSSNSNPAGLNVTENVPFVSLSAGGSGTFTTTFASTRAGNYTVHITGTGGANIANQTAAITVTVLPNISFLLSMNFKGVNATITGSLSVNNASRTISGSTFLTVVNGTTGAMIYSKTDGVSMTFNMFGMAHFIEEIPTSPLWLATSCAIDVNAGSASCFLSRTPDINHDGSVNILDAGYISAHYASSDPLANLSGTGMVNINDFGIVDLYYGSAVFLP